MALAGLTLPAPPPDRKAHALSWACSGAQILLSWASPLQVAFLDNGYWNCALVPGGQQAITWPVPSSLLYKLDNSTGPFLSSQVGVAGPGRGCPWAFSCLVISARSKMLSDPINYNRTLVLEEPQKASSLTA